MAGGYLTGVDGGFAGPQRPSPQGSRAPAFDSSQIFQGKSTSGQQSTDRPRPYGDAAGNDAGAHSYQSLGADEQSQKLRDFDEVQGRPPIRGERPQNRSPNAPEIDLRINEHKADLQDKKARLETERDQLEAKIGPNPTEVKRIRYQPKLDSVNVQLAKSADQLAFMEKLTTPDFRTGETPKVLAFDPAGDGKIVVAHGDIENAAHVAVMVPGMTSDLDNIGQTIDEAADLKELLDRGSNVDAATVAWLNYDAPDFLYEVTSPDQAKAGGPALRDFINGMKTREGADVTVFGHSYGSTVVGAAARGDEVLNVDRVVLMGSVGTLGDSTEGMNLPDGTKVFNVQNTGDYASQAGSALLHGKVPPNDSISLSGVGSGHTDYFANTEAMMKMVLGQTDGMADAYQHQEEGRLNGYKYLPLMP